MNNIKKNFSIRDLENISGVKAHTIRIWEKRYHLLLPQRTETNIRYYSHKNLQKLLNIVLLKNNDFKISKIAEMTEEEIILNSRKLALKTAINDEAIASLKLSMFQFDRNLFNETYSQLLDKKTFRSIFKEIFIPFFEHIGLMWQTDTIIPAHEHFITNLIVQKIQINTEKLQISSKPTGKMYVLFLPENEIHELGLLYLNYELTLKGHDTIYLGQNLPLNNLDYFFEGNQEICFITSMTVSPYDDDVEEYFNEIDSILNKSKHSLIAIGNKAMSCKNLQFHSNILIYPSTLELLKDL